MWAVVAAATSPSPRIHPRPATVEPGERAPGPWRSKRSPPASLTAGVGRRLMYEGGGGIEVGGRSPLGPARPTARRPN